MKLELSLPKAGNPILHHAQALESAYISLYGQADRYLLALPSGLELTSLRDVVIESKLICRISNKASLLIPYLTVR